MGVIEQGFRRLKDRHEFAKKVAKNPERYPVLFGKQKPFAPKTTSSNNEQQPSGITRRRLLIGAGGSATVYTAHKFGLLDLLLEAGNPERKYNEIQANVNDFAKKVIDGYSNVDYKDRFGYDHTNNSGSSLEFRIVASQPEGEPVKEYRLSVDFRQGIPQEPRDNDVTRIEIAAYNRPIDERQPTKLPEQELHCLYGITLQRDLPGNEWIAYFWHPGQSGQLDLDAYSTAPPPTDRDNTFDIHRVRKFKDLFEQAYNYAITRAPINTDTIPS
jgi:hypothetical protein